MFKFNLPLEAIPGTKNSLIPRFHLRSWEAFKQHGLRDTDIVIATYPKAGTTWTQEISYLIQNGGDVEKSKQKKSMTEKVPFLELNYPTMLKDEAILEILMDSQNPPPNDEPITADTFDDMPDPRLIKSHMPAQLFIDELEKKKTKFIIVMRNPKDNLVSFYHFYKSNPALGAYQGTWDQWFEEVLKKDKLAWGSWFDHCLSWYKYKDHPNVLIIKYEDMLQDLKGHIQTISNFMQMPLSEEVVNTIAVATSFSEMKNNKSANYENVMKGFMRKGKVGDWKNYFNDDQSKYIDNLYEANIKSQGIEFTFE